MRYLVVFLVLANLAYFAWYQSFPRQKPADRLPSPLPSGIDRLVRLSERPVVEPSIKLKEIQVEEELATNIEQPPEVAIHMETEAMAEHVDGNGEPTEASELETGSATLEPELVCHTVGPLLDTGTVTSISEELSQHGFRLNVRGGKVREPRGFWVYMPAMPATEARSIVADLDAQGMKDYFIGKDNHISLGIFSTENKAQKRLQRIRELGYEAQLGQRYRNRAVYWLDVEERALPTEGSQIWAGVQQQYADTTVQRVECNIFDR